MEGEGGGKGHTDHSRIFYSGQDFLSQITIRCCSSRTESEEMGSGDFG